MRYLFKKGDKVRRTVFGSYGYNSDNHGKPGVVYTLTSDNCYALFGDGDDGSTLKGASDVSGKFELVGTPTNDQIIAEAERRYSTRTKFGTTIADYVIEVVREGWTPTPVPADLLAARKHAAARYPLQADQYRNGKFDSGMVKTFVEGAAWRKANPTA
jgi:hypothetical protein